MDRELLIEIGCEEIPAGWLPNLTAQMRQHLESRLKDFRLPTSATIESFSTPRRLTVRVAKLAERQTDFEELVTGAVEALAKLRRKPADAGWRARVDRGVHRT